MPFHRSRAYRLAMAAARGGADLSVGLVVGLTTMLLLEAGLEVRLACTALAMVAGLLWRRPAVATSLVLIALAIPLLAAGGSPVNNGWDFTLVLLAVISLGAFASLPVAAAGITSVSVVVWWSIGFSTITDGVGNAIAFAVFAAMVRGVTAAAQRADVARHRAAELAATSTADVARQAVTEERRRLAADVEQVVRTAVVTIGALAQGARGADDGGYSRLHAIQEHGQHAVTELRRLLGLLRKADEAPDLIEPIDSCASPGRSARIPRGWVDAGLGAAVGAVAVADLWWGDRRAVPVTDGFAAEPSAYLEIAAIAATVSMWRRAPALGATALGGVALACTAAGMIAPDGGVWLFIAISALTWQCVARRSWTSSAAIAVLLVGTGYLAAAGDPDDVWFVAVIAGATAVPAYLTAHKSAAARTSSAASMQLESEHHIAAEAAVLGERLAIARELHDVVSHAVVVMVVQAGAAEAVISTDRVEVRRALETIELTATTTLTELDRLFELIDGNISPVARPVERTGRNVRALVDRMRTGGLTIELTMTARDDDEIHPVVYRVVQEALTNVLRHVGAARVDVIINVGTEGTAVEVVDDGPGAAPAMSRGYGLTGIAERVRQLGGTVEIGRGPAGCGFRVAARVPTQIQLRA
jgi:signal transduction histidine kinase